MYIELYIAVMAGVVLSLFLMVSEIVLMRKRVSRIRTRLMHYYQTGRFLSLSLNLSAIAAFFLVQPVIVGSLVVMALNDIDPHFSAAVLRQLRQVMAAMMG